MEAMSNEQQVVSKPSANATDEPPRRPRGFAMMDPATLRAIARKGGRAAHERGTAHEFTREEARRAGRKGGRAFHRTRGGRRKAIPEVLLPETTATS